MFERGLDIVSGDFPMSDALARPVTVVDQDPARLGRLAAQRVLDRIADPDGSFERSRVLQVGLVERGSPAVSPRG